MPFLYLSPSTQEYNIYATDGSSEEENMNRIADQMEPYLRASGIYFTRNDRTQTAAAAIRESNNGYYDLHLALHSNATVEGGGRRGSEVYYYPTSTRGKRAADIIADNLRMIYPLPDKVQILPSTAIGELRRTRAPAVLVEFAFHDDREDAAWIQNNTDLIAKTMVRAVCEYFGIPFKTP